MRSAKRARRLVRNTIVYGAIFRYEKISAPKRRTVFSRCEQSCWPKTPGTVRHRNLSFTAVSDRFPRRNYRVLPAFRNLPRCTVTLTAMTNKRHLTHIAESSQMERLVVSQRRVTARRKLCAEIVRSFKYCCSGGPSSWCCNSQVYMVGEERKLKNTANSKKGVVGSSGRKMPTNASSTHNNAPILNNVLSTGLAISMPGGACWWLIIFPIAAYTTFRS